jgi:mRNA interferase ChpB
LRRGDIYLVNLDPTSGHEQSGLRPAVIISTDSFTRVTKCPVILPITTGGDFARHAGYAVSLSGAGTRTVGVVRCDQPRAVDLGSRSARYIESLPLPILQEVLNKTLSIFD